MRLSITLDGLVDQVPEEGDRMSFIDNMRFRSELRFSYKLCESVHDGSLHRLNSGYRGEYPLWKC